MADEISFEEKAREKARRAGAMVQGSVNDLCTKREAIDCAVSVGRTVYDQIAEEHGKAFRELERQMLVRIRAAEATVTRLEAHTLAGRWKRFRGWCGKLVWKLSTTPAEYYGTPERATFGTILSQAHAPGADVVNLPIVKEFLDWGPESDQWLAGGGAALGPDALNPDPAYRRLRCPSTEVLRLYAEALGGDPADIAEGETSKAVTGEVLEDCRKLARGETIARTDTKPELVK